MRSVFSRHSDKIGAPPARGLLANGQRPSPSIRDINWHIAVDTKTLLPERAVPLDQFADKPNEEKLPYKHLQMLMINYDIKQKFEHYVLKGQSFDSSNQESIADIVKLDFMDCKTAIDFIRTHLTHSDLLFLKEEKLPIDLFINYEERIKPLILALRAQKERCERKGTEFEGIRART